MPLPDFAGSGSLSVIRAGDVRTGLFETHWSPASMMSNRLAVVPCSSDAGTAIADNANILGFTLATASGNTAYGMHVELRREYSPGGALTENSLGKLLVAPPGKLQPVSVARPEAVALARHPCEVQNVVMAPLPGNPTGVAVGSIDAAGNAAISLNVAHRLAAFDAAGEPPAAKRQRPDTAQTGAGSGDTVWLQQDIDEFGRGAGGWAGLAFVPGATSLGDLSLATAHHWSKRLAFYASPDADGGSYRPVRTVYTFHQPVDLCYIGGAAVSTSEGRGGEAAGGCVPTTPLLAVAEGHHLSIWDARVAEQDGCVRRLSEQHDPSGLLAVAASGDAVVTAGRDRCVHLYDIRMWRARTRWSHALKYPVANLQLVSCAGSSSGGDDGAESSQPLRRRCYSTDSGTELRSAYLDGNKPQLSTGFMGDAPFVGMAAGASPDGSYVAALSQKGTLYVL